MWPFFTAGVPARLLLIQVMGILVALVAARADALTLEELNGAPKGARITYVGSECKYKGLVISKSDIRKDFPDRGEWLIDLNSGNVLTFSRPLESDRRSSSAYTFPAKDFEWYKDSSGTSTPVAPLDPRAVETATGISRMPALSVDDAVNLIDAYFQTVGAPRTFRSVLEGSMSMSYMKANSRWGLRWDDAISEPGNYDEHADGAFMLATIKSIEDSVGGGNEVTWRQLTDYLITGKKPSVEESAKDQGRSERQAWLESVNRKIAEKFPGEKMPRILFYAYLLAGLTGLIVVLAGALVGPLAILAGAVLYYKSRAFCNDNRGRDFKLTAKTMMACGLAYPLLYVVLHLALRW